MDDLPKENLKSMYCIIVINVTMDHLHSLELIFEEAVNFVSMKKIGTGNDTICV